MLRKFIAAAAAAALVTLLGACGGADPAGDVAAEGDTRAAALAAARKPVLAATPSSIDLEIVAGGSTTARIDVAWSGHGGRRAYLDAKVIGAGLAAPVVSLDGSGRWSVQVATGADLAPGEYAGRVALRLCKETPCRRPIPHAATSVAFRLGVTAASGDWQTFQGNAAHNGHVPLTLDPAKFAKAWEWRRTTAGVLGFINAVATEGDKVFVTDDEYFGSLTSLYALNEADGSLAWRRDFVDAPALNPPAVADGIVYAATTGHGQTVLWAFRSADGTPVFDSRFDGQWPHLLAPTVAGGRVYTNGGYYGGGVHAFDATSGALRWSAFAGDDDMTTPAVDAQNAYHYSGTGLEVWAVADGRPVASIADPYDPAQGYSYHAAPMLGSADHVITFSGGAFSGRASASTEQYDSRPIIDFSVANRNVRWRTQASYLTQPAVAKGVVYAGRNNPKSFDAISESTGQVLWSWTGTAADTAFHRNVVVTDNLVFVSTDTAVHAIDLTTRQSVWSHPAPGMLAISAKKMLYIVEGARNPTGRLIAIRLQ